MVWALLAAAVLASPPLPTASPLPDRAARSLARAEAALARGDIDDAARAGAVAWVYLGSPLFARAWKLVPRLTRGDLAGRAGRVDARVAAARLAFKLIGLRSEARAALRRSQGSRRPLPGLFQTAAGLAGQCEEEPATANVDRLWSIPPGGETVAELVASCEALRHEAEAGGEAAERAAEARDRALRAVLRGDRLEVYERFGDPDPGMEPPDRVAHARTWSYVRGPGGPLATYETWTFTFRGDRLVDRRRVTSHEAPQP